MIVWTVPGDYMIVSSLFKSLSINTMLVRTGVKNGKCYYRRVRVRELWSRNLNTRKRGGAEANQLTSRFNISGQLIKSMLFYYHLFLYWGNVISSHASSNMYSFLAIYSLLRYYKSSIKRKNQIYLSCLIPLLASLNLCSISITNEIVEDLLDSLLYTCM